MVIGRTIKELRWMTDEEKEAEGWDQGESVPILILDDGSMIFPSQDEEGNGGGFLFGKTPAPENKSIYIMPGE